MERLSGVPPRLACDVAARSGRAGDGIPDPIPIVITDPMAGVIHGLTPIVIIGGGGVRLFPPERAPGVRRSRAAGTMRDRIRPLKPSSSSDPSQPRTGQGLASLPQKVV
jgi:hypothetical protein